MSPRDLVYVGHMLDMARKAAGKTQNISRETYDADENLRLALIHLIQTIDEAARQVSREFCNDHPNVRWADIIGMRHKVGRQQHRRFVTAEQPCRRWHFFRSRRRRHRSSRARSLRFSDD